MMNAEIRAHRQRRRELARMLRVNHAGELGAQHIYNGQLAVLGDGDMAATLQHMKAQEEVHLAHFENLLVTEKVRPTALHPFWICPWRRNGPDGQKGGHGLHHRR
jgi:ubiquinone biosynthesis monooxygenase Coq7